MMTPTEKKITDAFLTRLAAGDPVRATIPGDRPILEQYHEFLKCVALRKEIDNSGEFKTGSFEWAAIVSTEGKIKTVLSRPDGSVIEMKPGGVYSMEEYRSLGWRFAEKGE